MKLHKLIILTAKYVIGNACYRMSTMAMMSKCTWLSFYQCIIFSSLILFRKVIISECPKSIYNMYITSDNQRRVKKAKVVYTKKRPKTKNVKDFFIYKACEMYSYIPETIKQLNETKYRDSIKKYILSNYPFNKLYNGPDDDPP